MCKTTNYLYVYLEVIHKFVLYPSLLSCPEVLYPPEGAGWGRIQNCDHFILECIIFGFPGSSQNSKLINYCILYAKYGTGWYTYTYSEYCFVDLVWLIPIINKYLLESAGIGFLSHLLLNILTVKNATLIRIGSLNCKHDICLIGWN